VIANASDNGIFFFLASGDVVLNETHNGVEHVIGTATAGDIVGAETFAALSNVESPSAVAASDVDVLLFDQPAVHTIAEANPDLARFLGMRAEHAQVERLVRASRMFDAVSSNDLRGLLQTVERRRVAAGETIIRQGEPGTEAFVIVDGTVDVIDESTTHTLATLAQGALFGEAALINEVTRNATVRAGTDVALLVLRRDPFVDVVRTNDAVKARMIGLLNSRDRPLRAASIEITRQKGADGTDIAVLKNPDNHKFFRLSGDSLFLWERADGTNTIRDLTVALFTERQHFAPQAVIDTFAHLRSDGFLRVTSSFQTSAAKRDEGKPFARFLEAMRRVLTATAHHHDVDGAFATMYRFAGPLLFTWPSAVVLMLVALLGIALFALSTTKAVAVLWSPHGVVSFAIFLIPAYALLIILHEIGHGLGVKAIGRKVESVGVGWYWFSPVAFVDTSDSWAGTRAQRVLVSASGLAMNLLLAAIASAVAYFAPLPIVAVAAWQFALTSYIGVIENLNPLLEFDGYYILADLLDRPNLRRQSLTWMGTKLRYLFAQPSVVRGHRIEFAYAIGTLCYIFFAAGQSMLFYHIVGERQLARIVPEAVAAVLAWVFPIALSIAALAAFLAEMRKVSEAGVRG
jgi:CRP-like cAMP-binding protein